MPTRNDGKTNVVDNLRHSEYYNLQDRFDDLYQRSSNGEKFQNLMDDILSRENILLAYRNIKTNKSTIRKLIISMPFCIISCAIRFVYLKIGSFLIYNFHIWLKNAF